MYVGGVVYGRGCQVCRGKFGQAEGIGYSRSMLVVQGWCARRGISAVKCGHLAAGGLGASP